MDLMHRLESAFHLRDLRLLVLSWSWRAVEDWDVNVAA